MLLLVLFIMTFSLIGNICFIGMCAPLYAASVHTALPRDDTQPIVIEELFRDGGLHNADRSGSGHCEGNGDNIIRANMRKGIARRSVPILRSQGMNDEEIKGELLRDFSLTEGEVDEIIAMQ